MFPQSSLHTRKTSSLKTGFNLTQYNGPNIISLSPQHSTHPITLLTCSLSFQQYNLPCCIVQRAKYNTSALDRLLHY